MSSAPASRTASVGVIWAALVVASLAGFAMGEGLAPARSAATLAILLAAGKIHLIITHYMELRWAHQPLRLLLAVWLAVVTLILLAGCWAV